MEREKPITVADLEGQADSADAAQANANSEKSEKSRKRRRTKQEQLADLKVREQQLLREIAAEKSKAKFVELLSGRRLFAQSVEFGAVRVGEREFLRIINARHARGQQTGMRPANTADRVPDFVDQRDYVLVPYAERRDEHGRRISNSKLIEFPD